MTLFDLIAREPFVPHDYVQVLDAFPANAMPEIAYNKLLRDYVAVKDVAVSRIVYESDGLRVTGLMAAPIDVKPASHPVLIYNRGGSREYGKLTVLSALRSMVPYARSGYLVFASNYRGNDGGEGQEEFGGNDVHDVLTLLELAQAHPGFDGKNRFMIGHSRGGMMTALAIRHGAMLNAAVSIAGIAELHSMIKSPSMVENVFKPLIPDFASDPHAALSARSALDWPEKIMAPLQLLHGEADTVVPPGHSIRLAQALVQAGHMCELKLYADGNHALLRAWDKVLADTGEWLRSYTL